MTYNRNAFISLSGTIINSTFRVYASHASFEITNLEDIEKVGGIEEIVTPTRITYWGDLSNFNSLLRYTIRIHHATVSVYRNQIQYNVQRDNLEITDRRLQPSDENCQHPGNEGQGSSTFDEAVNAGLCLVFRITEAETLKHFHSMVRQTQLANFAEVVSIYPITHVALDPDKQSLLSHLLETPYHLATYCFLASYQIKAPSHDVAAKTMRLARTLLENPYTLLTPHCHEKDYTDYEDFTYDRLHEIALKLLGIRIMKESHLIQTRVTACVMQILRDEEVQRGNTWSSLRQVKKLLCQRLQQTLPMIEQIIESSPKVYQQIIGGFVVSGGRQHTNSTSLTNEEEDQIRLQHPDTRLQEDLILSFISYIRHRCNTSTQQHVNAINESLLRNILDQVYGTQCTRDPHQLAAIRLAISSPVSFISGPPGAGKTTLVVKTIVRYIEQLHKTLFNRYQLQYATRCEADEAQIEKELRMYTLSLNRKNRIVGSLYDNTDNELDTGNGMEGSEMQARFDELWDELESIQPNRKLSKHRPELHVKSMRFMVSQKLFELRYEKYRRAHSCSDLNMVKLVAPSGVAARRLGDSCDSHQTHTCCSLISQLTEDQLKEDQRYHDFYPFKMLIVDEASMIDLSMVIDIIKAAENAKCQLVFVGDEHQLPPIGSGQFFRDILRHDLLPCVTLQTIYRQGSGSKIAALSKSIVAGTANQFIARIYPDAPTAVTTPALRTLSSEPQVVQEKADIIKVYMPEDSDSDAAVIPNWAPIVAKMYCALSSEYDYNVAAVRVLVPYKEGNCGRHAVNEAIQAEMLQIKIQLNEGKDVNRPHKRFVSYDPVINKKNNKKVDIYNGDLGIVMPSTSANQKTVDVKFPHQILTYANSLKRGERLAELKYLELAYALTCHAAQGSQFPVVIVVLPRFVARFTTSLMLNTLISRASKRLIIVTQEEILDRMLREDYEERQTRINLTDFLYFRAHSSTMVQTAGAS